MCAVRRLASPCANSPTFPIHVPRAPPAPPFRTPPPQTPLPPPSRRTYSWQPAEGAGQVAEGSAGGKAHWRRAAGAQQGVWGEFDGERIGEGAASGEEGGAGGVRGSEMRRGEAEAGGELPAGRRLLAAVIGGNALEGDAVGGGGEGAEGGAVGDGEPEQAEGKGGEGGGEMEGMTEAERAVGEKEGEGVGDDGGADGSDGNADGSDGMGSPLEEDEEGMEGNEAGGAWEEGESEAGPKGSTGGSGWREARESVEVAAALGDAEGAGSHEDVLFDIPPLPAAAAAAAVANDGAAQQGEMGGADAWRGNEHVGEQVKQRSSPHSLHRTMPPSHFFLSDSSPSFRFLRPLPLSPPLPPHCCRASAPSHSSLPFPSLQLASKPAHLWRVAVCLVGGARDFELTGPSIVQRLLLPLLPHRPVLFLHAPLDHASFKLWPLLWAARRGVAVGAVRVFPSTWVNESALPERVVEDPSSPHGTQGMLQYFRLVDGCIPLIRAYERRHAITFDWLLRTRVDTFWHRPLPPLSAFPPHAYTIPFGSDCFGLNDRFGLGTWHTALPALSRLSMLPAIAVGGTFRQFSMQGVGGLGQEANNSHAIPVEVPTGLNSEQAFKAQLALAGVPVARADLAFCVVSRRVYRHHSMPVLSLNTSTPLNGAKCRPCYPKIKGAEANRRIRRWYLEGSRFGPHRSPSFANRTDFALCDAAKPWPAPHVVASLFDAAAGPRLARERHSIMHVSLHGCARNFRKLRRHAEEWQAPAEAVLCFRSQLGEVQLLGLPGQCFYTALHGVNRTSLVMTTTPGAAHAKGSWEWSMRRHAPGLHISALPAAVTHASSTAHTLKLSLTGADLPLIFDWQKQNASLPTCQLLLAFPDAVAPLDRNATITALHQLGFHLMACIQEPGVTVERCSFFSVKYCSQLLGIRPKAQIVRQ
ncbi:unnamed protein product [Closterium sp. NIES-53]